MDFQIKTKDDVLNLVQEKNVVFIRLQFVDILGTPKNIVIPACRLEEAFDDGIPFDASSIAGYATIEESDKIAKPDPKSFVILPEDIEKRITAKINCDIYEPNSKRFIGDTKYILEKVVKKAKELGYIIRIIFGYKFDEDFIFTEFVDDLQEIKQNSKKDTVDYMTERIKVPWTEPEIQDFLLMIMRGILIFHIVILLKE